MFRPLLLLMPRLLPAHGPEDQQEGAEALQDGPPELRGVLRRQELHPLPLHQVPQHRHGARAAPGRAGNKPSRSLKFHNHREGPNKGLLLVESAY